MVQFIERRGFVGLLFLASWPNAAFDLCGMACGAFLMPFWTFFVATLLGKGVFKVNAQSAVLVALFMKAPRDRILASIHRFLPEKLPGLRLPRPLSTELHDFVERSIAKFQAGIMSTTTAPPNPPLSARVSAILHDRATLQAWAVLVIPDTIAEFWAIFRLALVTVFAISCVELLAQSAKSTDDDIVLRAALARQQREAKGRAAPGPIDGLANGTGEA
ncbi:hypothetical protein FOA52_008717 [Chlamydomonas sp. UWO 241]|nr:hypothetical protein FOA52_008717 [Chlamydomonas sp. UWO 241]